MAGDLTLAHNFQERGSSSVTTWWSTVGIDGKKCAAMAVKD